MTVRVSGGTTILDAALDHGIALPHECGGNCACTTCHVIVETGMDHLSPLELEETYRLQTASDVTASSRLACQALIRGGTVVVRIPEEVR